MLLINLNFSDIAIYVGSYYHSAYIVSIGSFVMVGELRAGMYISLRQIAIRGTYTYSYSRIRIAIILYNRVLKRV